MSSVNLLSTQQKQVTTLLIRSSCCLDEQHEVKTYHLTAHLSAVSGHFDLQWLKLKKQRHLLP